jgi:Skp family chaperone for outer membrane proteins
MTLTPDQAKELRDMLKEIESLSAKLKANINTTSLQDVEANAVLIKKLFKDLKEEWNDLTSDISIAADGFRESVKEISRQNIGLNESIKAHKSLLSIADKIQAYQKGYGDLSFKNIAKLKEQSKLEKQRIENAQKLLKDKKLEYENSLSINEASVKAKQAEIALLSTKAGKTKQDYYELQRLRNEVKNLGKDYTKINTELNRTSNALTQNTALLNDQDEAFKNLNLSLEKIALESINDLDKSFKDMINDVSTTDQIVKNISKTFDGLSGISQKLQEYQENIVDVNKEDIEELAKKVKIEQQRLTHSLQLLDLEKQRLEASSTANKEDLQNIDARMSALQSLGVLTQEETAELA